jgi:hypothetical protein
MNVTISTALATAEPVYNEPDLNAAGNDTFPVPADPCTINMFIVCPGKYFDADTCVVTPLANEHVKKFAAVKSNDAVFVVMVGKITCPRNEPVTVTGPMILVEPLNVVDPVLNNDVLVDIVRVDNIFEVGLNVIVPAVCPWK